MGVRVPGVHYYLAVSVGKSSCSPVPQFTHLYNRGSRFPGLNVFIYVKHLKHTVNATLAGLVRRACEILTFNSAKGY